MATISTPQQQAGVMSFYDAPDRGPTLNAKIFLAGVLAFAIVVIIIDHIIVLKGA